MSKRTSCLVAVVAVATTAALFAAEKKVQLKDLPPVVRAAVQGQTKGAAITEVTEESDKGRVVYEVETIWHGRTRDLVFDAAGGLVAVEQEIEFDAAPAAVKSALLGRGTVTRLESVTKGAVVTYEAQVVTNGKRTEVEVGSDGKAVTPPGR